MQNDKMSETNRGKGVRLTVEERAMLQQLKKDGEDLEAAARKVGASVRTAKRWWDREATDEASRGGHRKGTGLFSGQVEFALVELARLFNCSSEKLSTYATRLGSAISQENGGARCVTLSRVTFWHMTKGCLSRPTKQKGWPKGSVGVHAVVVEWRRHIAVPGVNPERCPVDPLPQKCLVVAAADRHQMQFTWDLLPLPTDRNTLLRLVKGLVGSLRYPGNEKLTVWLVTTEHLGQIAPTIGVSAEAIQKYLGSHVRVIPEGASRPKGKISVTSETFSSDEDLKNALLAVALNNLPRRAEIRPMDAERS